MAGGGNRPTVNARHGFEAVDKGLVPVDDLLPGDSPRVRGEDAEHVRILAKSPDKLPPIVVHRPTMRVIDGMHRLQAAIARGDRKIAVEYFDGSAADAFVRAVRENTGHGLPLSRVDREAAVTRIIRTHPCLSDRAIADVVGLSPPTVGAIRRRSTDRNLQSNARVGRDGRVRPLIAVDGRMRASEMISAKPGASLREIARAANVSISTAQDVRKRVDRGEHPVPGRSAANPADRRPSRSAIAHDPDDRGASPLEILRRDPSLRFTDAGRALLQWMGVDVIRDERAHAVDAVPEYMTELTVALARRCAEAWTRLGNDLEKRQQNRACS